MDQIADAMIAGQVPWVILGGLVAVLLSIPLVMAYWFAPTLVAVNGMRAWPAMKLSFRACLWNILPFLVYGIIAILLDVSTILTLGLALFVLLPGSVRVGLRVLQGHLLSTDSDQREDGSASAPPNRPA